MRIEFRPTSTLFGEDSEWVIDQQGSGVQVKLIALDASSFSEARTVAVRGYGYSSEAEASSAGDSWRARFMAAFAALSIGADFGDRAPFRGLVFAPGLAAMAPDGRALNDIHGLMVFECEPALIFGKVGKVTPVLRYPREKVADAIAEAIQKGGLSEERQVSYDLFAASFGQESADAQFVLLMMALESMIDPAPRSRQSRDHIDSLVRLTNESGLPQPEVDSILGSLSWLRDESIGQAGRKLAKTLEPKRYKDLKPAEFFTACYDLRSKLLHGHHPLPTRQDLEQWTGPLRAFIADLLNLL